MPTDDRRLAADLLRRVDHGRVASSMRALPFLAAARHIVDGRRLLLRMHKGGGHPTACAGSVVAYGADNLNSAAPADALWSVQLVGLCEPVEPTPDQLHRFGPAPRRVDGAPYEPVYLRIDPAIVTVHLTEGAEDGAERHGRS
ncbi:pyridoxamine 5'-phosphate oxidase family protein [Streptomyces minutiscleroticus]|uniref:pyridoxamine 5'-phosphate oxidase family protein n=1 Tax=Streptomyces minutiscleroticus TaxID=68238 RepID=UPI00332756F1